MYEQSPNNHPMPHWAILGALFTAILSLRLWLIREWGSAIPFWDQWDAEARLLYRPWINGSFQWSSLLNAHNEHRIVLTRLLDLLLFTISGRWLTWWQLILNAVLNAGTATLLFGVFRHALISGYQLVLAALLVACFASPSGWQNALWGFQSTCYLVNGLGCLALLCFFGNRPLSPRWWIGVAAALLAFLSQASGTFACIAAAGVAGLGALTGRRLTRNTCVAIVLLLLLGVAGVVSTPRILGHTYLKAHSIGEFLAVFTRGLAYPFIEQPLLFPLLQAPFVAALVRLVRQRRAPNATEGTALALVLFSILNAAAIAYSRGAGLVDHLPISRYQDSLVFGVIGNATLLFLLCARLPRGRIVAVTWIATATLGLVLLGAGSLTFNLPFKAQQNNTAAAMIAAYRETRDPAVFEAEPPFLRPHPSPASVISVLDDPLLGPILPPEIRDGTSSKPWLVEFSPWLALISGVLLASALVLALRRDAGHS